MKIRLPRFNFKTIFRYILLLISTSIIFTFIAVSFPQTEKIIDTQRFDLKLLDKELTAKQYILDLTFQPEQIVNKWKLVNQTKDTIYNRLTKFGVEYTRIEYKDTEENKGQLIVSVYTTKDQSTIQSILSQRGEIKLVVKKEEANFENEEDPYARYLETNYNDSGLTRNDFRTIFVTQLKTTAGDEAYFGIFKPWMWNTKKYDDFLKNNSGKEGGMSIDGFVTPTTIPVYQGVSANQAKPIFAIGIANDQSVANNQDIILNSGVIPLEYSYKEVSDLEINNINFDLYRVFGLVILASIIVTILLNMSDIKVSNQSILSISLIFMLYVSYLKILSIPILSLSLIIGAIFLVLMNLIIENSEDSIKSYILLSLPLIGLYFSNLSINAVLYPTLIILVVLYPAVKYVFDKYIELLLLTIKR